MAHKSFVLAGLLILGCVVSHLSATAEEVPVGVVTPRVSGAFFVGNTEALAGMLYSFYGDNPEYAELAEALLPWARYTRGNSPWYGGQIVAGDKSWKLLSFPMSPFALGVLPEADKAKLVREILDHPIGKLWFPNSEVEILAVNFSTVVVVEKGFPVNYYLLSGIEGKVQAIVDHCYIGWYYDTAVPVPGEESTVAAEDATSGISGFSWGENSFAFLAIDKASDESSVAKARQARMTCPLPHRAGGFIDEKSPIYVTSRFFAEEAGLWHCLVMAGSWITPVELREDNSVYGFNIRAGIRGESFNEYPLSLKKGNFTFASQSQPELPPEEGVPSAEEMNAANIAFWQSLEPLMDEIAAKLGAGGHDAPVDVGAKYEDGLLLFAVAWQPGENEPVIDWNRLNDADLSQLQFPNPYRENDNGLLDFHVDVQVAGQWGDVAFSVLVLQCTTENEGEIEETSLPLVMIGQGPGILCGAVFLPLDEEMEPSETPRAMEDNIQEKIIQHLRTAMEKCLEESEQIVAANVPASRDSVIKFDMGDFAGGFQNSFNRVDGAIVSTWTFFGSSQASGMIAQFAQSMFADTAKKFGLTP